MVDPGMFFLLVVLPVMAQVFIPVLVVIVVVAAVLRARKQAQAQAAALAAFLGQLDQAAAAARQGTVPPPAQVDQLSALSRLMDQRAVMGRLDAASRHRVEMNYAQVNGQLGAAGLPLLPPPR